MANVFELEATLELDTSGYESKLKGAGESAKKFGEETQQSTEKSEKGFDGLSTKAVVAGNLIASGLKMAATAAVNFAKDSIQTGMQFDSAMSQVAATMGTTTDQIGELREFALQMGETTQFSAIEAAEALNYMALAGYDASESMQMLPTVLDLAAAGSMGLAQASDMITDSQTALGLSFAETTTLVDQMAATASNTNTSVTQLGDAILTVGATARDLAGGTTELNAVLGVLADNSIKGSEAGTHLRNIMLAMTPTTKDAKDAFAQLSLEAYDSHGNLRSLSDIFQDLSASLDGMTSEERTDILNKIFNKTDLAAVNALLGTTAERWDEVYASIENSDGAAASMAETLRNNLGGDMQLFQSAVQSAQIAVADSLTPALRELAQAGTESVSRLTEAFKADGIAGAAAELGNILSEAIPSAIEGLTSALPTLIPTVIDAGMSLANGIVEGLLNVDWFSVAGSIGEALVNGLGSLAEGALETGKNIVQWIGDGLSSAGGAVVDFINNGLFPDPESTIPKGVETGESFAEGVNEGVENIEIAETIEEESAEVVAVANEAGGQFAAAWVEAFESARSAFEGVFSIFTSAEDVMKSMANSGVESLDQIKNSLDAQTDYWNKYADNIQDAVNRNIDGFAEWVAANDDGSAQMAQTLQLLHDASDEEVTAFLESVNRRKEAIDSAAEAHRNAAYNIQTAEEDVTSSMSDVASEASDMEAAVSGSLNSVESTASSMADSVAASLQSASSDARNAGEMLGEGFAEGIIASIPNVEDAANRLASAALAAIKLAASIASPSKVTIEDGKYVGEGFQIGIEESTGGVVDAAESMAERALGTLEKTSKTMYTIGKRTGEEFSGGMEEAAARAEEAARHINDLVVDAWSHPGKYATGAANRGTKSNVAETVQMLLDGAAFGADTSGGIYNINNAKNIGDMRYWLEEYANAMNASLARIMTDGGEIIVEGAKLGVDAGIETIEDKLAKFAEVGPGNTEEAAAWLYEYGTEQIEKQAKYYDMTLQEQRDAYAQLQSNFLESSQEYLDLEETIFDLDYQIQKEAVKEQERLAKEREQAVQSGYDAIEDAQNTYVSDLEKFEKNVADIYEQIDDLHQQYADAVTSRADALANAWGAFDEVTMPDEATKTSDLILGLQSQVNALQEYSDIIDSLTERGISDALLGVVQDLGPTQLDTLRALADSTDEQLTQIEDLYAEKFRIANEQAVEEMEPLRESLNEQVEGLIDDLNRLYEVEAPNILQSFDNALASIVAENGLPEVESAALNAAENVLRSVEDRLGLSWNGQSFSTKSVDFGDSAIGTATAATINAANTAGSANAGQQVNVSIEFEGELGALGRILQPVVKAETERVGGSLVNT